MGRKHRSVCTYIEKTKKKKSPFCNKVDTTQCKNCLYRPPNFGEYALPFGCYYIVLTGKRRPSEPSPNCTAFKKYNRREREKLDRKLRDDYVKDIFGKGGLTYRRTQNVFKHNNWQ